MSDLTGDPRRSGPRDEDDLALANLEARPAVARTQTALPVAVVALALTLAGVGVFLAMNARRVAKEEPAITTPIAAGPQAAISPPPLGRASVPPVSRSARKSSTSSPLPTISTPLGEPLRSTCLFS